MSEIIRKIEEVLAPLAKEFTPVGSEIKSTIHQWAHAIAFQHQLFAEARGANRNTIIELLKEAKIYINHESFERLILQTIAIQQNIEEGVGEFTFIDLFAGIGGMSVYFSESIHPVSFQTVQPDQGFFFLAASHPVGSIAA